ncbi:acetyltransferase, GNAT family protein [Erythrobacter sp. NAP1]|uniref:GNAT family N-acetyltransferase n=1 Tax=Erythrobacter sp. NAP1 TaxID=237727 RepID=UPI0000687600|nr:N-acetyltransferase [Erythrobacter sp. NAP1]EAQ28737.1 acetyltransferase, GNAT family protein [Erythrobacter sp. NAP1]
MIGPEIPITIRPEAPGDEEIIFAITEAAFADMKHSDGDEQHLVDRLRKAGDLTLSLVAEDGTRIVGHIAISPVKISDGAKGWYGLGPVSVWPEVQRAGIGGALVKRAIADMRAAGAMGIVLLGSPEYYSRFGFQYVPQITFPGPPAEYFQTLLLDGEMPSGEVTYAPGFYG